MPEEEQYISLTQASQFCEHSQGYLSLRARQKKLKAKKIGRNWFTTRAWLQEYLDHTAEYKTALEEKRNATVGSGPEHVPVTRIPVISPSNLPARAPVFEDLQTQAGVDRYRYLAGLEKRIGLAFSLTVFLVAVSIGAFAWRAEILPYVKYTNSIVYTTTQDMGEGFVFAADLGVFQANVLEDKITAEYPERAQALAGEYIAWLKAALSSIGKAAIGLFRG